LITIVIFNTFTTFILILTNFKVVVDFHSICILGGVCLYLLHFEFVTVMFSILSFGSHVSWR